MDGFRCHCLKAAPLGRRVLAILYEMLLLAAVLFLAGLILVPLTQRLGPAAARPALQVSLLAVSAAYFVWQWRRGGQTLAMKTWRIRLVAENGAPLDRRRALMRFIYAATGAFLFGVGFAWALVDPDRQFLHDRLAGTRLVKDDPNRGKPPARQGKP